jgi:hypothetical protein
MAAELNNYLEQPVFAKSGRCEFHKSNIYGRVEIVKRADY